MNRLHFHQFFTPIKRLGNGNFAAVYLAETVKDRSKVAVKAFSKSRLETLKRGKEALLN